jgi:hypothetical protein
MRVGLPSHPHSFLIEKRGDLTVAQDGMGRIRFSGTDAASVIQSAINALPGTSHKGIIFVKTGTYNDVHITLGKSTRLIGESMYGVIFNQTTDGDCITIDSSNVECGFSIENIRINMNGKAGHGIYSAHASHTGTLGGAKIENVMVRDVAAGKAGIYLIDPFRMVMRNIHITTSGTGIYLGVDPSWAVHFGNSLFDHILITFQANDVVGIDLQSSDTYVLCLMQWNRIDLLSSTSYTGTVGLRLRGIQNSRFITVNSEHMDTAYDIGATTGNKESAWNDFLGCRAYNVGSYAIYLRSGSYYINFVGGEFTCRSSSAYFLRDSNWFSTYGKVKYNKVIGATFYGSGLVYPGWATKLVGTIGFQPVGKIANPFGTVNNMVCISPTQGTSATPTSATTYRVVGTDMLITSTGGSGVSIDVLDPDGNTILSGQTALTNLLLPIGYQIKFTYTTAPTVTVCGV